jgi:hypothetical protein
MLAMPLWDSHSVGVTPRCIPSIGEWSNDPSAIDPPQCTV